MWKKSCGTTSTLPARRRVFVELPPKDHQASDEHMCGLLQYHLHDTRDAAQNWGGGAGIHTQRSQVEETKDRVPTRVWRGCIKGKHIVTTVHGNPITIGGERSVVKFLIKMKTRKYETKKQVIGEDADVEKGGRILSLVVEWSLDRITSRRIRDTSGRYSRILSNERITLRLRAERMRATEEVAKARGEPMRTGTDSDQARVGRHE